MTTQLREAIMNEAQQERERIERGLQCPECLGARVTNRQRKQYELQGFQCEECGCNWTEAIDDQYA